MADVETWNNKGEFPGAYLSVEGIDESWITDSAVLKEKIKVRLEEERSDGWSKATATNL